MMQVFSARFFQTKPNFRGHFYSEFINEYSDKTFSTEIYMWISKSSYYETLNKESFKTLMDSLLYTHRGAFFL